MDFKVNRKPSIPYGNNLSARSREEPAKSCFGHASSSSISFLALLFSISLLACCFCLATIYVSLQSEAGGYIARDEQLEEEGPRISLSFDPETRRDEVRRVRAKRQIAPNIPDCRGRQEECRIVLEGVRGITKSVQHKLDRLQQSLVQHGILKEKEPKDAKFRKIVECLQCRNAIGQHHQRQPDEEKNQVDAAAAAGSFFGRRADGDERISELLPFLENSQQLYWDEEPRAGRLPKTAAAAVSKQVLESVTNTSKLASGAKITEILHNTTIVEREQEEDGRNKAARQELSQVTRNMDAATPIILPTAETTKTSQQIQFTPQSSWPSIPVCFYGPPSSSNSYQQLKQTPAAGGSPFFPLPQQQQQQQQQPPPAYGQQAGKFFLPNGQPPPQWNFPQMTPQPQPTTTTMMMMMGQGQRGNLPPVYCTFMPANSQLQQFSPFPAEFQRQYVATAKSSKHEEDKPKSTYDESDEKYYASECAGFWCNPPYKKCIAADERCDGKVDCMGAEDEIDCPYVGYYSRFRAESKQKSHQQQDKSNFAAVLPTDSPAPQLPAAVTVADLETTTFDIGVPLLPPQFTCTRIVQTIPLEKRCDNVYDCEDASDEEDCTCKDYLRYEQPSAVCNGHVDCLDGSDEHDCDFCREDQYHCHRSGDCIPKHKRCDQSMDCKLNEDELDCFALTDGQRVNLDLDKRPHLNLEGVLTQYDNGAWRPSCFKSEYRNFTKRMGAGQKICEYLGFKNVDFAENVLVKTSKLVERPSSREQPVNYEYPPQVTPAKREANNSCYGLRIRCKAILDRKVNVHLRVDAKTKERTYLWPWEASVFVDGKYHCSAVLLENDLLLSSSECSKGIELGKNYTTATLGLSSRDLPFASPYQQTSQIVDVKPLKNSDASLFRLRDGVNMTRYVQPVYLEKRIFPAARDDTCVALGVNDRRERRMQFLQPILDNCPKCHRCYTEKSDDASSTCSKSNETTNWSGNVVCLSSGGWYPAAVFQDKDQNCGFGDKQILNSIDYIHAHLSQAIADEKVELVEEPKCEGIRCSLGECIPWDRVCDGVRECRDGADESPEHCRNVKERCENGVLECKCSKAELRCGDGKCLPKEMFCDGKVDCADGSDEPASCSCAEYLKLTEPKRVCDGRRHCLDKSDENFQDCLCKDSSFKCAKSLYNGTAACIPQDYVCDGEADCPYGEDEAEEVCWAIKSEKKDPKGKGEVMRRNFGVLHSECFPRPIQTQREVTNMCAKLGYTSGLLLDGSKTSDSQYIARNDFYMFQLNNYTWMSMRPDTSFGVWLKPESSCYRLFLHCI